MVLGVEGCGGGGGTGAADCEVLIDDGEAGVN